MMTPAMLLPPPLLPAWLAQSTTVVIPQLEGVTTATVAFIFVCVVYPQLVKNKTQFYAAFTAVLLIILLHSLHIMMGRESAGFQVFAGAAIGLLQVAAIVLLFASCGGVTLKELAGDMAKAYEVIRRGEEEKTVIVPLTGEMPRPRQQHAGASPSAPGAVAAGGGAGEAPPANQIDLPPDAGWPTKKSDSSSIPLE